MIHYNKTLFFSCVSVTLVISQMGDKIFQMLVESIWTAQYCHPPSFKLASKTLRKLSFRLFD